MKRKAPSTGRKRPEDGSRNKLLSAAELLFAEHGYNGCTFRMISKKAGINQGLLHYHFGSKENLFSEMFVCRAQELVAWRMRLLDEAEAEADGAAVPIERLVRCFIEPPLRMLDGSRGQRAFIRIHAHLRSDPVPFGLDLRRRAFGASTTRFVEAMKRACPHLSLDAVVWRFNSMVGSYLVVVTQGARIEDLSGGLCSSRDIDAAIEQLVPPLVAAFQAPDIAAGASRGRTGRSRRELAAKAN